MRGADSPVFRGRSGSEHGTMAALDIESSDVLRSADGGSDKPDSSSDGHGLHHCVTTLPTIPFYALSFIVYYIVFSSVCSLRHWLDNPYVSNLFASEADDLSAGQDPVEVYHGRLSYFWTMYGLMCGVLRVTPQGSFVNCCYTLFIAYSLNARTPKKEQHLYRWYKCNARYKLMLTHGLIWAFVLMNIAITGIIWPSKFWFPGCLWFYGPVGDTYSYDAAMAAAVACPNDLTRTDLCLTPQQWSDLSAGMLSPEYPADVLPVYRGLQVIKEGGGLVLNILARDVEDSVAPLVQLTNILAQFVPKTTVVVFENDSVDNTRRMFKNWAASSAVPKSVTIDIMTCEKDGSVDCKLKELHRYDQRNTFDSITGRMAAYRNRFVDHVLKKYKDHSHMLIYDMDLAVPLSVLGVLHSIGTLPNDVVASRGVMPWQGSLGALIVPYDMTAYKDHPANGNWIFGFFHSILFSTLPEESALHNNGEALSPFVLGAVEALDVQFFNRPYRVGSAFHGATIYPIARMNKDSRYDSGPNKQRCEHVGFNYSFKNVFINPKWKIVVDPEKPGGPSGVRAAIIIMNIFFTVYFWPTAAGVFIIAFTGHCLTFFVSTEILRLTKVINMDHGWFGQEKVTYRIAGVSISRNTGSRSSGSTNKKVEF